MAQWTNTLGNIALGQFVVLAMLALWQWRRHRARGAGWAVASFAVLAGVAVTGELLEDFRVLPPPWAIKALLAAVLIVPFCFYRFAAAFDRPRPAVRRAAIALTAGAVVWTALLPYFPLPGMPEPSWFVAYRTGIAVQWGLLFAFVAIRLWMAGADQPAPARNRMRLLAAGAAGLDVQIIVGALGLTRSPETALASGVVTVVMAVLFCLGLTAPTSVRAFWRRRDGDAINAAVGDLVSATSLGEVADSMLPHVAGFVGASRAALVDRDGTTVAVFGDAADHPEDDAVRLSFGRHGGLVVWTNPYIPFFARDELQLLEGVGHLLDLVMERFASAEREQAAQNALAHQALHDDLTGLPNRALFIDRLHHAAAVVNRHGTSVAVMFIDLDRFKLINDGIDHAAGDAVLINAAKRLADAVRGGDTVARFGGDEFVVLAEVNDEDEAMQLANRCRIAVGMPMEIDGRDLVATASIGVVVSEGRVDAAALIRDADAAMYRAKDDGRDRVELFSEQVRDNARDRLDLERELRHALGAGEISLVYQPVYDLRDHALIGLEALVRWQHPRRGVLLPARFVPLAEESDLIVALDTWVVGEAARQMAEWRRTLPEMPDNAAVWVNMSAGQFHRAEPAQLVAQVLADTGLPGANLGVEITESVFMSSTARIGAAVGDLKQLGISIAIDDFGTGFSSLGYLKRFPVDVIKIDSSFVQGIGGEPETSLVTACLALAASLGIRAVAEGVETAEHAAWLADNECAAAQGFHYGPPVDPSGVVALLTGRAATKLGAA